MPSHCPRARSCLSAALLALITFNLAAQEAKLDNRQKQAVERQERNLAELKAKSAPFASTDELAASKAPTTQLLAQVAEIETKCDSTLKDLQKSGCPADHPRVKVISEGVEAVRATVAQAKPGLSSRAASAAKAADVASYPDYDKDVEHLETIAKSYAVRLAADSATTLAELMKQDAVFRKFVNEKAAHYKPLVDANGKHGSHMKNKLDATIRAIKGFTASAQKMIDSTQKDVSDNLERAEKMVGEAIEKKNAAWFDGGIKQCTDTALSRITVYTALAGAENESAKKLQEQYQAAKKKIDAAAGTMKTEILAAARAPEDVYDSSDKAELLKSVTDAWKKEYPGDKILKVVFHMKDWDRSVKAHLTDGGTSIEKIDMSVLCVIVFVKTDDTLATGYPAYLNVDNISNKKTTGVGTKGSAYVHREVLLKNL